MQPRTVEIRPSVTAILNEEGSVLLDLQAGRYYSLNPVGACIWECIQQGHDCAAIEASLGRKYNVDADRARTDVERFISTLLARGLVTCS